MEAGHVTAAVRRQRAKVEFLDYLANVLTKTTIFASILLQHLTWISPREVFLL